MYQRDNLLESIVMISTFSVRLGGKASSPNRKAMIEHYKDFTIIETITGIGWDIKERLKSKMVKE